MSYSGTSLRKPLRSRSQLVSSGRYVKKLKTKRAKPKPVWDDSVNDLTVHKPSRQELQRNHALHQPKKEHERLIQRIESSKAFFDDTNDSSFYYPEGGNTSLVAQRKAVLLKQGFYNQERELHDLFSETDKTLAEVQDMFGDDIYKYKSVPVFTKAPNFTGNSAHSNISVMNPGKASYYDTLSESIVRELNGSTLSDEEEDSNNSDVEQGYVAKNNRQVSAKGNADHSNTAFQHRVNVDHYQNILSQNSMEVYQSSNEINVPNIESLTEELKNSIKENDGDLNSDMLVKNNSNMVANCSLGNKTLQKNVATTALQTFDDMKKMLDSLENEIVEYEKETGKENIVKSATIPSSISGYTANLLSVIIRLTHHLKQSEVQLKVEMAMRTEILDMFDDQRQLVDVLTNNVMELEESNDSLKKELHSQKIAFQTDHANLKKEFENLERRFNLAISNGDQRIHPQRKPFDNMTNIQGDHPGDHPGNHPVHAISWLENKH